MEYEEITSVLRKVNKKNVDSISDSVLDMIIARVIEYPLDGDRGKCQSQIKEIISQSHGVSK